MKGCLLFLASFVLTIGVGVVAFALLATTPTQAPVGDWVIALNPPEPRATAVALATATALPTATATLAPTRTPSPTPTAAPTATATVVVVANVENTPEERAAILREMKTSLAGAAGLIAAACILGALVAWRLLRREPEVVVVAYDPEQEELSDWQKPGYTG